MLTCTAIHATCSVHTETAFTICFNNHRKYVKRTERIPASKHYNCKGHSASCKIYFNREIK